MARTDKKQQARMEKNAHRRKYRILKELRWWLAGILAVCVAITVWAGIDQDDKNKAILSRADGTALRDAVAISGGETEVSIMALSYYFYEFFYNIIESENFISEYRAYGLDPEKPLKELEYTALRSWFDELLGTTYEGMGETVRYAELARKSGTTLSDEDKAAVEAEIDALKAAAKDEGMSLVDYLDYRYAPGMTVEDLRAAISFYNLAEKQYNQSLKEMMTCSDADIDSYFEANKTTLLTMDYASHTVYGEDRAELDKNAAPFLACKTEREFADLVEADIRAQGAGESDVSNYLNNLVRRIDYSEKDELTDWAFAPERAKGDTHLEYTEHSCTIYLVIRASGKVETPSANARSMLISRGSYETAEATKEAAEKIYADAVANGTEEYFISLVKQYSYDQSTASYGGEYADIVPGDVVTEYEEWVFAEGRKSGDIGMVESNGDYHIIYYLRSGDPCWKVSTRNALIEARVSNFTEKLEAEVNIIQNEAVVDERLPDDLATDRDRGYTAYEEDGKVVYKPSFRLFTFFNIMLAITLVSAAAAIWGFAETARLNKKYKYSV